MGKKNSRFDAIVHWLSGECFLENGLRPNGGTLVLLRTIFVTMWVMSVLLLMKNLIDPTLGSTFSFSCLRHQLIDLAPWAGAVFGGVYLALYSRFASQWSYLANIYNQIKLAEVTVSANDNLKMAQWKAGFIEDAICLHLAQKPIFVGVVAAWGKQEAVKDAFLTYTPDGKNLWGKTVQLILDDEEE